MERARQVVDSVLFPAARDGAGGWLRGLAARTSRPASACPGSPRPATHGSSDLDTHRIRRTMAAVGEGAEQRFIWVQHHEVVRSLHDSCPTPSPPCLSSSRSSRQPDRHLVLRRLRRSGQNRSWPWNVQVDRWRQGDRRRASVGPLGVADRAARLVEELATIDGEVAGGW